MTQALFPHTSAVEILESRIAPAGLVTFSYTDADDRSVTITTNKGTLEQLTNAIQTIPAGGDKLQVIAINLDEVFKGADLTIVAGASDSDGITTKIGFINAAGIDLGKVNIDGDISRIDAGDDISATAALRKLTVGSWGKFDVNPEIAPNEFDSTVIGSITALKVKGDFEGAWLNVRGSDPASPNVTDRHGRIGDLEIDGSLLGTARTNGGYISTTGDIGTVTILGSVRGFAEAIEPTGPVLTQNNSGRILSGGSMGSITVGTAAAPADIVGGDGFESGQIASVRGMGALTVHGNIIGGFGEDSGAVGSGGVIGKVTVDKSVLGGTGLRSGAVLSTTGMQAVEIGDDLKGGIGENSGFIASSLTIRSVTIGRDVLGGDGDHSGSVGSFGPLGAVKVTGDLIGGDGIGSGQIVSANTIKGVEIGGDLVGGSNFESGSIGSLRGLGAIKIGGSIYAGAGDRSGLITTEPLPNDGFEDLDRLASVEANGIVIVDGPGFVEAPIASVTVGGSIFGLPSDPPPTEGVASGFRAGGILSSGKLGPVIIGNDLIGGDNFQAGIISSHTSIQSITILGRIEGGSGDRTGLIEAQGNIGPVIIGGNLEGGEGEGSGLIGSGSLTKITVGGNVFGGNGGYSGVIETRTFERSGGLTGNMGPVLIKGSLVGGDRGPGSGQIFSAGKLTSVVIGDPKDTDVESGGSLVGGFAPGSGVIASVGDIGPVTIKSNILGGGGDESGKVVTDGKLAGLTVGGSISGATGNYDIVSGETTRFGQVFAGGAIGFVEVEGSLFGGQGRESGQIRGLSIGRVDIGGNVTGGTGDGSGSIVAYGQGIGSVDIGGSLISGNSFRSGWVTASDDIGSVEVQLLSGSGTQFDGQNRPRISAVHTLHSVTISSAVFNGDIVAGYDVEGQPVNADAQIGKVLIGPVKSSSGGSDGEGSTAGNAVGMNIVAGGVTGGFDSNNDGFFGTFDDEVIDDPSNLPNIYSRIASVVIKGQVFETDASFDRFGIVAEIIGSLKVGASTFSLTTGPSNDPKSSSGGNISQDTAFRELGLTFSDLIDSGSGAGLIKTGSGTLTLSGSNTFTGGTAVTGGTLTLGGSGLTLSNGILSTLTLAPSITLGALTSVNPGTAVLAPATVTGLLPGSDTLSGGLLTPNGGVLTLTSSAGTFSPSLPIRPLTLLPI